jgi:hypothetical protein
MNDFFIGDSDFLEVAQRAKAQQQLAEQARHMEEQSRLLKEQNQLEQARLAEARQQTHLLQAAAEKHEIEIKKAEELRKYLQSARKEIVRIAGTLDAAATCDAEASFANMSSVRLYADLLTSQARLQEMKSDDRLDTIADIEALESANRVCNDLLHRRFREVRSLVSETLQSLSRAHQALVKGATELYDRLCATIRSGLGSDGTNSQQSAIAALGESYAVLVSHHMGAREREFMQLYVANSSDCAFRVISAHHQVPLDKLARLLDVNVVFQDERARAEQEEQSRAQRVSRLRKQIGEVFDRHDWAGVVDLAQALIADGECDRSITNMAERARCELRVADFLRRIADAERRQCYAIGAELCDSLLQMAGPDCQITMGQEDLQQCVAVRERFCALAKERSELLAEVNALAVRRKWTALRRRSPRLLELLSEGSQERGEVLELHRKAFRYEIRNPLIAAIGVPVGIAALWCIANVTRTAVRQSHDREQLGKALAASNYLAAYEAAKRLPDDPRAVSLVKDMDLAATSRSGAAKARMSAEQQAAPELAPKSYGAALEGWKLAEDAEKRGLFEEAARCWATASGQYFNAKSVALQATGDRSRATAARSAAAGAREPAFGIMVATLASDEYEKGSAFFKQGQQSFEDCDFTSAWAQWSQAESWFRLAFTRADVVQRERIVGDRKSSVREAVGAPQLATNSIVGERPGVTKIVFLGSGIDEIAVCWVPDTGSAAWWKASGLAGYFLMGSVDDEGEPLLASSVPQHRVAITKGFWLGKYEVTERLYRQVMAVGPEFEESYQTGNVPVHSVTWLQACRFCERVQSRLPREMSSMVVRLPTEAEWEYACRATTITPFHCGMSLEPHRANFGAEKAVDVGKFPCNFWGLHDMHGNVAEWCRDGMRQYVASIECVDPIGSVTPSSGDAVRAVRGGSWMTSPLECRSAYRKEFRVDHKSPTIGFRLLLK